MGYYPRIMDNQMEKKMEKKMGNQKEIGVI